MQQSTLNCCIHITNSIKYVKIMRWTYVNAHFQQHAVHQVQLLDQVRQRQIHVQRQSSFLFQYNLHSIIHQQSQYVIQINYTSISANTDGPCDTTSRKIDHIALHTEYTITKKRASVDSKLLHRQRNVGY